MQCIFNLHSSYHVPGFVLGTVTQAMFLCFENNTHQLGITDPSFTAKKIESQRE